MYIHVYIRLQVVIDMIHPISEAPNRGHPQTKMSRQNLKQRHHRGLLKKVHGTAMGYPMESFHIFSSDLGMPTLRKCFSFDVEGKFGKSSTQNCRRRIRGYGNSQGMCIYCIWVIYQEKDQGLGCRSILP